MQVFGFFLVLKSLVTKHKAIRSGIRASDGAVTLRIAPAMTKEYLLITERKDTLSSTFLEYNGHFLDL